jgi:hypothetical protein
MPDGGGEEAKEGLPFTTSPAPEPATRTPQCSPLRAAVSQPSRPSRPTSLSMSMREAMRTGSPDSYTRVMEAARETGDISPKSQTSIPTEDYPQGYDGTRRAFYETALNRNLPFNMLSRASLRFERQQEIDDDRSLTPNPLCIVKNTGSTATEGEQLNERQGGMRRAHTEPLGAWEYTPLEMGGSIEQDLIEDLNSIDGTPIDEEIRRKQREDTLNYLEGVLPMSPPISYRGSSVYSRNQWGIPILRQEGAPPTTTGQNSRTVGGGSREPEGKGKVVDRSETGGGKWI